MNDKVNLERQVSLLKQNQQQALTLLKQCQNQVGTLLGEQIAECIAKIEGKKFNPKSWDLTDKNGEQ